MYFIKRPQNKILLRRLTLAPEGSLRVWNGDTRTENPIHFVLYHQYEVEMQVHGKYEQNMDGG